MNLIFGSCLEEAEKMRQVEFLSLWCFGGGPYGEGCPGGPRGGPGGPGGPRGARGVGPQGPREGPREAQGGPREAQGGPRERIKSRFNTFLDVLDGP